MLQQPSHLRWCCSASIAGNSPAKPKTTERERSRGASLAGFAAAERGGEPPPARAAARRVHPRVRALYKEIVFWARQHPTKPFHPDLREEIRGWFRANAGIPTGEPDIDQRWPAPTSGLCNGSADATAATGLPTGAPEVPRGCSLAGQQSTSAAAATSPELKRALARGRYFGVRQLQTLVDVHKFRAMKARYDWEAVLTTPSNEVNHAPRTMSHQADSRQQ